ncbi:hypothetical protein F4809DRAFT_604494 [Biscogniauxia mediterranea]|nr:hypothetical protein F4809DRAFT_604494 [Biscogniauxia mediterranea]
MEEPPNEPPLSPAPRRPHIGRMRRFSSRCFQSEPYPMARRPTFGQWLKISWPDLLTMLVIGAIAMSVGYDSMYQESDFQY